MSLSCGALVVAAQVLGVPVVGGRAPRLAAPGGPGRRIGTGVEGRKLAAARQGFTETLSI